MFDSPAESNTSKNHFEVLFHVSRDLMCIAGVDGYLKTVNKAMLDCFGYPEQELLNTPFIELLHKDDIPATLKAMQRLKQGEPAINFENRYRCKDGRYVTLNWTTVSTEDGLLYSTARDVTEERELEFRLRQIESALRNETIMAITDPKGIIIYANKQFEEVSGYSKEELVGQTHRIINSGKHDKSFFADLWRTISSGRVWSGVIENRRKNGEIYVVHTVIVPIVDNQNKIINYLAFRFDITDKVMSQYELDRTVSILNETSSIARVGGWELDIASGDLTWTDETFNILEVDKRADRKPVLPEGINLFVDEHQPIIEKAVQDAIEQGTPYSLELKARTAKGNELWVYTNGKPNYRDGKVVTLSGTIQDIDAKKIAEKKYEIERMHSIQSAKLASLGELAAGIAHEINNPLSIIAGAAELIERFDEGDRTRQKISTIKKSGERIARIVKSLKRFSRTNETREFTYSTIKHLIDEAIVLTSSKAKRHNCPVTLQADGDCQIFCDEIEIEQVFINLINNSIDAVDNQDDKWINIHLDTSGEQAIVSITDSGKGIDNSLLDNLFTPFFTTKENGKGTGLGLSITKGILDEHDATIIYDRDSINTCFKLSFNKAKE
ncbi:MAG: PAS domain S-box protein [Kangiellaceae bacterium]|jgi:PAS domain S-box-containing protein|nr:PAS domain S-box protein [Kangiellaceae bacterium]